MKGDKVLVGEVEVKVEGRFEGAGVTLRVLDGSAECGEDVNVEGSSVGARVTFEGSDGDSECRAEDNVEGCCVGTGVTVGALDGAAECGAKILSHLPFFFIDIALLFFFPCPCLLDFLLRFLPLSQSSIKPSSSLVSLLPFLLLFLLFEIRIGFISGAAAALTYARVNGSSMGADDGFDQA